MITLRNVENTVELRESLPGPMGWFIACDGAITFTNTRLTERLTVNYSELEQQDMAKTPFFDSRDFMLALGRLDPHKPFDIIAEGDRLDLIQGDTRLGVKLMGEI